MTTGHATARNRHLLSISIAILLFSAAADSAVTLDGTLGTAGALAGPAYVIPENVGQTRGTNLFHSFGQFGLTSSESATFTGSASIQNIIGRVTGGEVSNIDGLVRSSISGANLYLINPSGIVFGPNASLDVPGSFYASTAGYMTFADGGRFDASTPSNTLLSVAAPAAFGFLGGTPAPIQVNGAYLAVPVGKELSLIGGDITLQGWAALIAASGRVNVASVASAGEVTLEANDVAVGSFAQLGAVTMQQSYIDTLGNPGGRVFIRGARLVIDNSGADFSASSGLTAIRATTTGSVDHPGTAIDIALTGDFYMHGGTISASSNGAGRGGDIRIAADRIELHGAAPSAGAPYGHSSVIASRVFGTGGGGDIQLTAREITLQEQAAITTEVLGSGMGGNVSINADQLRVLGQNGYALVSVASFSTGNAGNLDVTARDVMLQGGSNSFVGLTTQVNSSSPTSANAGAINITTGSLQVLDGAQISAGLFRGNGTGGNIQVSAGDIVIAGRNAGGYAAGIFSNVDGLYSTGMGGNIAINADSLALRDGGMVSSAAGQTYGAAGNIQIAVGDLSVSSGGLITASTKGTRDGGDITINAAQIRLSGQNQGSNFTGISTYTGINGGAAGDIQITSTDLQVLDGAQIDAGSTGGGAGGGIHVISDRVLVAGRDTDSGQRSSILSSTRPYASFGNLATGRGGDINIEARDVVVSDYGLVSVQSSTAGSSGNLRIAADTILLTNDGLLSATSSGTGTAGNIDIVATDALRMRDSAISTQATQSDGGNITIAARSLIHLDSSAITASVQGGSGNGGNISIDPEFVILNHSQIAADAFGGNGGNVSIVANYFLASTDSSVTASSTLGLPGNVAILAPTYDLSGDLVKLPDTVVDASTLFKSRCTAVGSRFSSFTVAGPSVAAAGNDTMLSSYAGLGAADASVPMAAGSSSPAALLAATAPLASQLMGCSL